MKKLLLIIPLVLLLSGCGASLEERVKFKESCEEVGGLYREWSNGFTLESECYLGDSK